MKENKEVKKLGKVKSFLKGIAEKLDKKMQEKSKSPSCCCNPKSSKDSSCCS